MEPLSSKTPILANAGNHETLNEPGFVAFRTRFGAMPFESPRFDDSGSLFYSTEVGAMHIVCLSAFSDFSETSVQTFFLINDLASVNRTRTPWLIAAFHAPWYNSNKNHYLTAEAMMVAYEPLLLAARVNIVMVGHVHAFQRTPLVGADGEVMPVESGLGAYHWMVGISGKSLYANWVPEEFPEPQPSGKPPNNWVAARDSTFFGMAFLEVPNATHARMVVYCTERSPASAPGLCDPDTPLDDVWVENQLVARPIVPTPSPTPSASVTASASAADAGALTLGCVLVLAHV